MRFEHPGTWVYNLANSGNALLNRFGISPTALLTVLALTFALLLAASDVQRLLGVTGLHVISRTVGVLLSALVVQFIFDGLRESGLFIP